jgi:hypothetical protein
MRVAFTKTDGKRYVVGIDRDVEPPLLPRFAPGFDDLMPHDLAHYLVEELYGIELGVFGQLAAGAGGVFSPAPEDRSLKLRRREERIAAIGRADVRRSEQLVQVTMAAWEREVGRTRHQGLPVTVEVAPDLLAAAAHRVHDVSARWAALAHGQSLVFEWPAHLTVHLAGARRGRRHRVV